MKGPNRAWSELTDPNAIRLELAGGSVCIIDQAAYPMICDYRWRTLHHGYTRYAVATVGGKTTAMHRLLICRKMIDHVDHDGLNNRRSNLRPCSIQQNMFNRRSFRTPDRTSRFKGVCTLPNGRFRATIKVDGRQRHLGCFESEEDAARAYDDAARRMHGAFACLNLIE